MEREPKISAGRRPKLFAALRVLLAAGIGLFICQLNLDYIESLFYDIRVRTRPAPQTSGKIALINIDTKTQERLKRQPEALDIAFFLRQLAESKPAQIIYTQDFSEIIGSFDELEDLAAVATKIPFVVVEDHKLPEVGLEEEFRLLPPLQNISVISGPKTDDSNTFARDGVTRRMILTFENSPLLHMKIASSINNKMTANDYRGSFDFKRTSQAYINFHPSGFYDTYSYIDIIDGKIAPENFKDKIIIIGRDTHSDRKDYVQTPYSRDILAMSRTELHANIIDTLLMNDAPLKLPEWFNLILTMFIAILTVLVVLRERPARGFLILAFMLVGFSATAILLFSIAGIWIDVAHPFLSLFICYYFFIPYRLIVENRRSWEYYQRNTLLTQVEELKSNFLKMMSHDLKTPLARIQGMTEIAMRDPNKLSSGQSEALMSIRNSSQELTEFIGSILDLGRIESNEIKLHLKSKDINALLNEIILKLNYLAKLKNISIVTEFEPMFSIKIDENLIRQVFTNLIENAIKYSPPDTSILVSTEETAGHLIVQVADQGVGIPKSEHNYLFRKFYRGTAVRDSAIKGSGLGLYLSNYFVDLHKGKISVESEPERGSTFTVDLPMDLK